MSRKRKLLLGKILGVLLGIAITFPTLCSAQMTRCFARDMVVDITKKGYSDMMGGPPYTIWYEVEVDWNCTPGQLSDCRVCEMAAIFKLNPATNGYEYLSSTMTQDFTPVCASPNTSTWTGSMVVTTPGKYKIVEARKNTNGGDCTDLGDYNDGDVDYVTIPP